MRRAERGRRARRLLACLVASWGVATAQPYAAAGDWARPHRVKTAERAVAAVAAAWPTAGPTVAWAGQDAVWAVTGGAAPERLAAADNVRAVSAGSVGGELVVAWAQRDRNTGLHHHLLWRHGAVTELFTDPLAVEFTVMELGGVGYLAAALRRDARAELTLIPVDGGESLVFHRTPLSVRGLTFAGTADGGAWAAWLQGRTERTEFGVQAEWHPYVALLQAGDVGPAAATALGDAEVADERQRAVVAASPTGDARVLWTSEDGGLVLGEVAAVRGAAPTLVGVRTVGADGRPLAAAWPRFYWTTGTSFALLDASDPAGTPRNVLWSPVTVEGAAFASATAASSLGPANLLAWYGRAQGGGVELWASNDTAPMRPGWTDRLAALMGWNPWFVAEQAVGQALTSLLVGVLAVLAAVPFLLVAVPLTVIAVGRRRPVGFGPGARPAGGRPAGGGPASGRPAGGRAAGGPAAGLALGALPLLAAAIALAATGVYGGDAPAAAVGGVALALGVGFAAGGLAARRGDRELQSTVFLAAATTIFAGVATWSFITYAAWAPLVGLA